MLGDGVSIRKRWSSRSMVMTTLMDLAEQKNSVDLAAAKASFIAVNSARRK